MKSKFEMKICPLKQLKNIQEMLEQIVEEPEKLVHEVPEVRKFFFEEMVGGITRRITQCSFDDDQYAELVYQIVLLLGELFIKEIDRDNSDMADGMRALFDSSSHLHQLCFSEKEEVSDPSQVPQNFTEEEKDWRDKLTVGSKVDVIKMDWEYNLKLWSKAEVILENGSNIRVRFDNDNPLLFREIQRFSPDLAPYNTYSSGEEWREDLKEGDFIDAFDSTKVWYASTIQKRETRCEGDHTYLFVSVGFRLFHPQGNKEMDDKRKYFGWSDRFDEWLSAYSPRILKYQSVTKPINDTATSPAVMQQEDTVDDQMDLLLTQRNGGKPLYAVVRRRCRSGLLATFLNRFGLNGGFQKVLDRIMMEGNENLGFETIYYYLDCFAKSTIQFNKQFISEYLPQLEEAVRHRLTHASELQLRNAKKDRIDGIVQALFGTLETRTKNYRQRDIDRSKFLLDIGCVFLQSSFMERRIDGSKIISDVCRTANLASYSVSSDSAFNMQMKQQQTVFFAQIIQKMKDENVLYQIFSKEKGHLQLVQRTEELIKLLIHENSLSDDDLDLIWNSTKIDEAIKLELYRVLSEVTSRLKIGEVTYFVNKLSNTPLNKVIMEEVQLLAGLAKRARNSNQEYGVQALEYLWKISFDNNENIQDRVLIIQAGIFLTDILRNFDNNDKIVYNKSGITACKMIMRIIKDFSPSVRSPSRNREEGDGEEGEMEVDEEDNIFENKSRFIEYIDQQYNLMDAFYNNFRFYMLKAKQSIRIKQSADSNLEAYSLLDTILFEQCIHSESIRERLEMIKYVCGNSRIRASLQLLQMIWDEMIVFQNMQAEANLFYQWLNEIIDLYQTNCEIVRLPDLLQFFKERISKETKAFQFMTQEGFKCIISFFILLNESSNKILRLQQFNSNGQPVQKFTSQGTNGEEYSSYSYSKNNDNNDPSEDIDFHVLVHPNELEGLEGIWSISLDSSDSKVTDKAVQFLIKLYTSVTYKLQSQISDFEDCFVERCIQGINFYKSQIESRVEEPKEEFLKVEKSYTSFSTYSSTTLQKILPPEERKIVRYLNLIQIAIKNSERDGTREVKSHSSLFKGEFLHTIQVGNSLKKNNPKYSSKFEVSCYSNTTLWELRKIIGIRASRIYNSDGTFWQDTPVNPSAIRIYKCTGCTDLKEFENGKTLAELRFKPNEQLTAFSKNIYQSSKVPLLNEKKDDMSDHAKAIFTEWFHTYSEEDPDNAGRKIMTLPTCVEFIKSCTEEMCSYNDSRVKHLFENYDPDFDNKIQYEDFMRFYLTCCLEKEEIVRTNLYSHGYRQDFKKSAYDYFEDHIQQVRQTKYDMPRYKISNNPSHFNNIFGLLELHGEVAQQAWVLIRALTTNPKLYKRVLKLEKADNFDWKQIFESSSIYKMLYTLQIVESLLDQDHEDQKNCEFDSEQDHLKEDWIQRFLKADGFQEILNLFHDSLNLLSLKQVDALNKFEKNFLEYMMKMVRIFMLSAFSANDESVFEVMKMVKATSTKEEKKDQENTNTQSEQANTIDQNTANADSMKTPVKQIKGQFKGANVGVKSHNAGTQAKNVTFGMTEINEEFLFGESGNTEEVKKEEAKQEDSQNKFNEKDTSEDDSKRFKHLAIIMKETGLGEIILNKIDFKDLQKQVLEVVCIILSRKEIGVEDVNITGNALSLWLASLIRNENLIEDFYAYERPEVKIGNMSIKNASQFIMAGLMTYKSLRIREEFSNTLACICTKIKNNKGVAPLIYVIDILKQNFPRKDQYYATRECEQFFELFKNLVESYFYLDKEGNIYLKFVLEQTKINMFELLYVTIGKFKAHDHLEKKKGTLLEDRTLIGYYTLIEKLITHLSTIDSDQLNAILKEKEMIHELFYEHLFYHPLITKTPDENKSKTKESRAAAYALLTKVIEALSPKELADFLEFNIWPLIQNIEKPKKWKYVPAETNKTSPFVGLINLGCICYMNAMLQQFFMVPAFRYQLLKAIDTSPVDIREYKGLKIDDSLLRQLQKMFANLELSERYAFNPQEFCFAFKDFEGNPTNTALQQDAQEFLNIFFDRIEELLKPTSQKHLLEGVFGGKVCQQLICQSCGKIRNILEGFYNLSLPVKDRKGLEDSLVNMIEGSIINDFKCEGCNQRVDVFKRSLIAETPNVLVVHLQRIIFNFDTFQNDKVNTHFSFPNILNLKDYSFKTVMSEEGRYVDPSVESPDIMNLQNIEDQEFIYKLVGVIIHLGTAEHGHYYSLINTKRGQDEVEETKPEWAQTEKDTWKQFEDDKIKYFSFSDLKSEAFGGQSGASDMTDMDMNAYLISSGNASSYGKNAYMLVYERMKKKTLIEIVVEQEVAISEDVVMNADLQNLNVESQVQQERNRNVSSVALECANTAISRDADVDMAPAPINEEKQNKLEKVEIIKKLEIPFRSVKPFVPENIKNQVLLDNTSYLMDKHIYHESFFNLMKSIFKQIGNKTLLTQHKYQVEYIQHFKRLKRFALQNAHKVLFEFMSYSFYNTQMSDINNSMSSIIQFCDSHISLENGDDCLILEFIEKAYLNDNCQAFFNIMFNCPDKTSRYYMSKLASMLVNKGYQIYEDAKNKESPQIVLLKQGVERFVTLLFQTLSTKDCQKNWARLDNYLKLLQDIGTAGKHQAHFILTQFDIVGDLITFFMYGDFSMAARNGNNPPAFEPIIALVCYFIRFSLTPQMKELIRPPKSYITFDKYDYETLTFLEDKYPLSERATRLFINTDFIDIVLKAGYECEELGKALAHFCFQNLKFTKKVSKNFLKGISRNDMDKVKNYLDVVTQVVLVRDQYQRLRLEWIFGFGVLVTQTPVIQQENSAVNTKVGIKCLSDINDDVFVFRSPLTYNNGDDALLHLLWRYKGRMDSYTVSCLFSLLNLIVQDDNVATYFAELPGPSYCLSRYTDWIRPYLNEQLIDARKGYNGSYSAQKEETVVKALSLYEKYDEFLLLKDPAVRAARDLATNIQPEEDNQMESVSSESMEENIGNLIQQSPDHVIVSKLKPEKEILPCDPPPYIILECTDEEIQQEQDFDGVVLQVFSLSCFTTVSQPTGNNNLSIPKGLLRRHHVNFQRPSQNRETKLQSNYINNYFESSSLIKPVSMHPDSQGEFVQGQTGEQEQENAEGYVKFESVEQPKDKPYIIQDGDENWKMDKMNVSDIEEGEEGYQQDNENQNKPNSIDENNQEAYFDQTPSNEDAKQTYKIQVIEEGQEAQEIGPWNENQQPMEEIKMNSQAEEQNPYFENDMQIVWPNQIDFHNDLVVKIQVQNNRNCTVKVNLKFNVREEDQYELNYPRGGMKALVYVRSTKTIFVIAKRILNTQNSNNEESLFQKLGLEFYWKEQSLDSNYQNQSSHLRERNNRVQVYPSREAIDHASTVVIDEQQLHDQNDAMHSDSEMDTQQMNQSDNAQGSQGASHAIGVEESSPPLALNENGMKQCQTCTLFNDPSNISCEVCDAKF